MAIRTLVALLCCMPSLTAADQLSKEFNINTPSRITPSSADQISKSRAIDIINVKDFGAKCDGDTDDAAAINSMFDYVRNVRRAAQSHIVFPQGTCVVKASINATGLKSKSIVIEGAGTVILGKVPEKVVFDALSTQYLTIRDLAISGDAILVPSAGLRIGRAGTTTTENADNIYLDALKVYGNFSFAAVHNLNAETTTFVRPMFANSSSSETSYVLVMDGLNHFDAKSEFVNVNSPVDSSQSFNENVFIGADVRHNGYGVPIWMGQTTRHRWISGYIAAVHGSVGVILYSVNPKDANSYLDFDTHIETSSIKNTFVLSGPNPNPALQGFKFRDQYASGSNSLFKLDRNIRKVTMYGADLEIGGMPNGSKIFDAPELWFVSGRVTLGNFGAIPQFNTIKGHFAGQIDVNGSFSVVNDVK